MSEDVVGAGQSNEAMQLAIRIAGEMRPLIGSISIDPAAVSLSFEWFWCLVFGV